MVMGELPEETDLLVIGGGPGGYAAAFRAADLGLEVTIANDDDALGGVCLLRGCIPSKALLHQSALIADAAGAADRGIAFAEPEIDLKKLRTWKDDLVGKLTRGLTGLCKTRGVKIVRGRARFIQADTVRITGKDAGTITFKHAIVATGSRPAALPEIAPDDAWIMDSTGALDLETVPEKLLVIGGGYVGLELGQVYAALGSKVTLVEAEASILSGADRDLTKPLKSRLRDQFDAIHTNSEVTNVKTSDDGVSATIEGGSKNHRIQCDKVLLSIGRRPNTEDLGLEHTGAETDDTGFLVVDEQQRTKNRRVFAVGDAAGGGQLAHKAMHEGRVAAEVIAGQPAAFDARAIPAVVYTDPQIAWCGETGNSADRDLSISTFPWRASGRALLMEAEDGLTKLWLDARSGRVLGMGVAGKHAESLIAEGALAIEMGATAEDLALTVHAHPTLSETVQEAAGLFLGHATDYVPRDKAAASG